MLQKVIIFLSLLFTTEVVAQQTLYRHFTVEDGLPSLTVHQIVQDHQGYIWFATDKGIGKYDGYQFTNFTIKNGLPSNNIREFFVDTQNRIWLIGDGQKVTYIQNNSIITVKAPIENITIKEKGIHQGKENIWIDSEEGIFYFEKNKLKTFDLPNSNWNFLGLNDNNEKLFYTDNGEIFNENDVNHTFSIPLNSEDSIDSRIFQWEKDWIYFETENQLYFLNTQNENDTLVPVNLSSAMSIAQQRPPFLVARRDIGYLDKNNTIQKEYIHNANFRLQGAFKDREENWWLSSANDGVYLLSANAQLAKTFNTSNGLDDHFVTAVTKDKDGTTYIGTENGDLYSLDLIENYPNLHSLNNARNIKSLQANEDFLFVGSKKGLHLLDIENFNFDDFGFGFAADLILVNCAAPSCSFQKNSQNFFISGDLGQVNNLFLKENKLYIASETGVWLMILDGKNTYEIHQLTDNFAHSAVVTSDKLYTSTSTGVFEYQFENEHSLSKSKSLLSYPTLHLALGNDDDIWFGTDGYGVFHYKNKKAKLIASTSRDIVEKIIIDQEENVWAATNFGVKKIVAKNGEYMVRPYQVADGLPTRETSTLYSDQQNIYIGTNRGLTILDKLKLSNNQATPPVFITRLFINNKPVELKKRFRLPYFKNNLSIEFVGISIKSNKQLTYQYKLTGSDRKWQTTQNNELSFRGLSPKRYTFHIRAIDVEGKASEEKIIQLHIIPPFWQTLWFRAILTVLICAGLYWLIQNRIRATEKKEQEKAQIQQERTVLQLKVAEEKAEVERINNELAKSKLETLQAQMNPHFAYNALTSIQKLVLKKDNKTANKYLVKFARLMRQFLEASKETYIPLHKEIELLQLYIEMEQLRFKDKFEVKYEIDPHVNLMKVPIPSMLLQVFVENAINHGLVYKEDKGLLLFKVKKDREQIICIVEDDGIGRKKAQEIKKQSAGSYKGLGMKITYERVKYLNMMEDVTVHIDIEDDILGEIDGGTRVSVIIEMGENA